MIDILSIKKAYLVGIKGVGMTALASILKKMKIEVVGSDIKEKFFTDDVLKKHKIKYYESFHKNNLKKELPVDIIISSLAYLPNHSPTTNFIKENNDVNLKSSIPEINLASKLKIPILSYPQALSIIFNQSFGIAICGSHGKSSTTAILGHIFKKAGLAPNVVVGSEVINWQSNSLIDKNLKNKMAFLQKNKHKIYDINFIRKNIKKLPLFIIEADEYKESFLNYYPKIIIITNIDYDHPDYFKNKKEYNLAFKKFIKNATPPRIIISHHTKNKFLKNEKIKNFPFPFPGKHFQKNLQLIYALTKIIKMPLKNFINSIKTYRGIKRRFEIIKNFSYKNKKIIFIDDYAHHPTEILSFYKSLTEKYPNYFKYLIFQPHTYSRTHYLFKYFKKVFITIKKDKLIKIILFKTFPSARETKNLLKIKKLSTVNDLAKVTNIVYFESYLPLANYIKNDIFQNKYKKIIISTIGAGNIYNLFNKIKF